MSDRKPQYKLYIDWLGHGGLVHGLNDWLYDPDSLDSVTRSTEQYMRGGESLKVLNGEVSYPMRHYFNVLKDIEVTMRLWVYVPAGSGNLVVSIKANGTDPQIDVETVTVKDEWHLVEFSYTATEDDTYYVYLAHLSPAGTYYIGWMETKTSLDDTTGYMASTRDIPDIVYGRDSGRDLESITPGEVSFALINDTKRFTPGNPLSPVSAGIHKANRQVVITAEFEGVEHIMYVGYIDDFTVDAMKNSQIAAVSCTDELGRLASVDVSTELFPSVRTGEAIREVKLQAGLYHTIPDDFASDMTQHEPLDLYIDSGSTTLRWWGYSGDALTAIKEIQEAEGPPSIYSVGISGQVTFRDRVHRLRTDYPTNPVVTLTSCDPSTGFLMHESSHPDYGWKKIINRVTTRYNQTSVSGNYSTVWKQPGDVTWGGQSPLGDEMYEFTGTVPDGYYDAQNPVEGTLQIIQNVGPEETDVLSGVLPEDYDFIKISGIPVVRTSDMKRSGTKVYIPVEDDFTGLGNATTVRDMSLKAKAIERDTLEVIMSDDISIKEFSATNDHTIDMNSATTPDAESVTQLVLSKRSFPRPMFTAVLQNLDNIQMAMLLTLDIGTPIHVIHTDYFIDEDFAVEGMRVSLGEEGYNHKVVLYLEQINPAQGSAFTFDVEGLGFDDGSFGASIINSSNAFILGSSFLDGPDILAY